MRARKQHSVERVLENIHTLKIYGHISLSALTRICLFTREHESFRALFFDIYCITDIKKKKKTHVRAGAHLEQVASFIRRKAIKLKRIASLF